MDDEVDDVERALVSFNQALVLFYVSGEIGVSLESEARGSLGLRVHLCAVWLCCITLGYTASTIPITYL